jgi:hypothetical protein
MISFVPDRLRSKEAEPDPRPTIRAVGDRELKAANGRPIKSPNPATIDRTRPVIRSVIQTEYIRAQLNELYLV